MGANLQELRSKVQEPQMQTELATRVEMEEAERKLQIAHVNQNQEQLESAVQGVVAKLQLLEKQVPEVAKQQFVQMMKDISLSLQVTESGHSPDRHAMG